MERQSERKNNRSKAVIIIVAMLLMVALVVGMGAMTYSKYITSGTTGDQTATAAKWGFVVTVNANNLLGKNYDKGTGDLATIVTSEGVAVKASSSTNVVAPGTTGSMTITISGSAEVLAKLSISSTSAISEIHFGDYYPVVWTLTEGSSTIARGKLETVIAKLKTTDTDANLTPGTTYEKNYTLTWEWAFSNDEATSVKETLIGYKAAEKGYDDIKDLYVGTTQLSSIVATSDDYGAIVTKMSFDLTVSVEQIQE